MHLIISVLTITIFLYVHQFAYAQPVEDKIIENTLETVDKAATEGLSEINESESNTSKSKEYKSEVLGIKLQIPSEWYIFTANNSTDECFGEDLACNVMMYNVDLFSNPSNAKYGFFISKNSFNGSLKDFTADKYNELQNSKTTKKFSFIDDKETTVQGYPAWQIEYNREGILSDHAKKEMETYVKVNNTFYSLYYSPNIPEDYDAFLPVVQNVINSTEFISSKPPDIKKPSFLD
jgi:hypothetical protein